MNVISHTRENCGVCGVCSDLIHSSNRILKRIYCLGTLILTWNMVIGNTTCVEKRILSESASFGVFEKIRISAVTLNLDTES